MPTLTRQDQSAEIQRLQVALQENKSRLEYAQERYQALVEFADDAFLVVDFETAYFIEANDAACRMFGYSVEEFSQLKGRQLHPPSEASKVDDVSAQINATGKGAHTAMMFQRKDGVTFWGSTRMWTYQVGGARSTCA